MFEDECQRASWRRHGAIARGVAKRGLVAFLAFAMAFGTTPAQLWAEGAEGIAEAVTQTATAGEGAAADDGTAADAGANSAAASTAADGAGADQGATASSANGADTDEGNAAESENPAVVPAASEQKNAIAAASTTTLSSKAKVFIQDTKDKDNSYSTKSGALKVGETLWANMYDEVETEDYWGDPTTETQSVRNPSTWTYTWLAGTVKASNSVADYTEDVGHEQSLTVTDAMVGKYFICKVTVDGKDYYGPSVSDGSGINPNFIPGPVLGAGQANLYSVKLSSSSPAVGDTLTATPYTAYNTPAPSDTKVTYTWYESTNKSSGWTEIEGATTASLTLTDALEGKYVKVKANAGVNDAEATTSDAVLKAGAVKLAGVELSAPSTEIGATLTAKAYTGSSYSPSYVDNSKVTYTWKKYKGTSAPSSSTKWETIEGESGPTFTVTDDLEGYYVSVSANAGANDVSFGGWSTGYGVGPFKQAGAVDIYSAILAPEGSTSGTYVYTVDDTVQALAKEKGASDYIDASKLSYQWQVADAKGGTYTDIEGATSSTLKLAAYEGKSVRCHITAKIGSSDYTTKGTSLIGAAGSVNITKVTLDLTVEAKVGEKITATAKSGSDDVTSSPKVTWSWYCGDSPSTCDSKIEGADTNSFTPDAALANKYVQARANGGFGDEQSSTLPVVEAGAVDLYGVTVQGALASGQVAAGKVLTAKATKGNSYTDVSATDTVHYQWQYSNDKSSYDSHFANIPDAIDSSTYTPTADMVGKYIRVIVTSKNSVKSTEKKSTYGGTQSVDPVGPVTLAGQYKLKSVAPNEASSTTLSVGTVLTPRVKIPGSSNWSDSDLPEDAKLTLAWYAKGEGDSDWAELTEGIDTETGALTLNDSLVGKRIKLTASALDNTVEWVSSDGVTAAGQYNLLRVTTTPQINSDSTHLVSGDSVKATVQAKRADGSTTNGIDVTDQATVAWYAADDAKTPAADWTLLSDMSGATATVSASAAGKYLKAVATSGSSTVELVSVNPVIAVGSLKAAVQKLNDANKQIAVDYSAKGGNVNDALKAQLADLGFTDVNVKVSEGGVLFKAEDAKATVSISDAQDKTNGDVTFFFIDPNDYAGYNIDGLRSADVVFELSRGDETEYYQPNKTVQVAWDEARVQQMLDDAADQVAIGYAAGDSAESVTSNLTLPYRTGSKNKLQVEWKSSDGDVIWPSGYGYSDYTGKVTRASSDRAVTLTATVSFVNGGPSDVKGSHDFTVTVKGDPEKVAADKKALQEKVDAAFTYDNIKYSGTDAVANKDGLTADLQMPRTSTLNIDGKYYKVEYSASTDDITFNGYKGTVYQPLPGAKAASTKITLTVTNKSNAEVTASKTLDFAIAPQDQDELDAELSLMEKAKAGYAAAILNGQDASAVSTDMHAFQKAYLDADGNLAWSYNKATTDSTSLGIVPVDLPGYDAMSGQDWRLFKSSNSSVVAAENLKVTQPQYNTKVTISSRLTSEKYARYAERYPDNDAYAKLANQDVSATLTVLGTTGVEDPNAGKTIIVKAGVTGLTGYAGDSERSPESIVPLTQVPVQYDDHKTAEDVLEQVLENAGCTDFETNSLGLTSLKTKDGRILGSDWNAPYRYWSFYVNGTMADVGATQYAVQPNDTIEYRYFDGFAVLTHTVTFDAGEGSAVAAQKVEDGKAAAKPDDPAREGYTFAGWYSDAECTQAYDFSTPVSGDVTLYAKWTKNAAKQITVSATLYGVDDGKMSQPWAREASLAVDEGSTIQKVTERYFESLGIDYQLISLRPYGLGGVELYSVTSTVDGTVLVNKSTSHWQAYVNGARIDDSLDEAKLNSGDKLVWRYLVDGKRPAERVDGIVVEPDADRPVDSKSDANGFGNAVTNADTPTGTTAEAWTFNYKQYAGGSYANASEPVIVDGHVYLAVNDQLLKIDCQTGEVVSSAKLKASVSYTARPVYAKGLVMVPLSGGSVQALTVDRLKTVWMTSAVSAEAQASSSLTVDGDYLFIGTADGTRDITKFVNGFVVCVDIQSGKVVWKHNNADEGYYWTGGVVVDGKFVVPTSSGTVEVLDQKTGEVLGELALGVTTNSSIVVSQDGKTMYLVTRDGSLHVISFDDSLRSELSLSEKSVDLGLTGCASTPTLLDDNTLLIGGEKGDASALAIVDLKTMGVKLVSGSNGVALPAGGIKASPLVSKQAEGTYVYFTVNGVQLDNKGNRISGGGVYRYKMGDAEATLAYDASGHNEYCDSPVVSDRYGNLYYINDSGTLFRLSDGINVVLAYGDGSSSNSAVFKGNKLVKPADPTREGYAFAGWYTDEACTKAYDFSASVTADMTLFAKWTKKAVDNGGNGGSANGGGNGGSNGSAGGSGNGAGSGNGTSGQQSGGAVSPGQKPISTTTTTETKDDKDSKKDSDKSDKKDGKSDKSDSSSDTGSSVAATVKKSAAAPSQESGFNPLAIVGVAAGVIGLAVIGVFVLTKRR